MARLLIVEDDADLAANLAEYLEGQGHELDFAYDGGGAIELASHCNFDVLVLDIGLPKVDGIAVAHTLKALGNTAMLLMLTARHDIGDKSAAFAAGADDYLTKPFALAELEMRIQALLRRGKNTDAVLRVADLEFNPGTATVLRGGARLELNRSQRQVLALLMRESPRMVGKAQLAAHLWGDESGSFDTLRAYVHELRTLIDKPFDIPLLHTVHGEGYVLRMPDDVR